MKKLYFSWTCSCEIFLKDKLSKKSIKGQIKTKNSRGDDELGKILNIPGNRSIIFDHSLVFI